MNGLENLKKGDKVTIIHQHRFGDICIQGGFEVNHITATLVVGKPTPLRYRRPYPRHPCQDCHGQGGGR